MGDLWQGLNREERESSPTLTVCMTNIKPCTITTSFTLSQDRESCLARKAQERDFARVYESEKRNESTLKLRTIEPSEKPGLGHVY